MIFSLSCIILMRAGNNTCNFLIIVLSFPSKSHYCISIFVPISCASSFIVLNILTDFCVHTLFKTRGFLFWFTPCTWHSSANSSACTIKPQQPANKFHSPGVCPPVLNLELFAVCNTSWIITSGFMFVKDCVVRVRFPLRTVVSQGV